jgi:hypothetical protein
MNIFLEETLENDSFRHELVILNMKSIPFGANFSLFRETFSFWY